MDYSDTEQDDVLPGVEDFSNLDPDDPDCNYKDPYRGRVIPCARDLEDFARLWVCGITPDLVSNLPYGSTITLSWGDVGYPNPNNPTIDLFQSVEGYGGIGYLTNETTAAEQIDPSLNLYMGRISPGQGIQMPAYLFENAYGRNHLIWCGVTNGTGGLTLTVADGNGNVLITASQWIQIVDIKQMYERWTVGDNPDTATNALPLSIAIKATDGLQTNPPAQPFLYAPSQNTNTPYILFVHGWNMPLWEKDRFAETAFKRLYWQGYQGRFGEFRWPTYYAFFAGEVSYQAFNLQNFDHSEFNAWRSGTGLLNKLNDLNTEYPGHVYLFAHSMGNVVAGEAFRLAGTNQPVNTYIAMQGAVSAHAYDPSTVNRTTFIYPDDYANYWTNGAPCYFNDATGSGTYVNFFNTNDWALDALRWQLDQSAKPDFGYGYSQDYNFWYHGLTELSYTVDRYQIFAYCDPSWSYALGAQPNVGGAFKTGITYKQVELDALPYSFGTQHKYHSGQFRSDNPQRWQFWNQVLVQMKLK